MAPDLSDIGAVRSAGSLQRSLARSDQPDDADQPSGARRDEGRHGRSTAGGSTRTPTPCSSSTTSERLLSLVKADLREYTISTTSPMPSYKDTLSDDEIADVLAYLLSLKGQLP